jgi:hypothetical protein
VRAHPQLFITSRLLGRIPGVRLAFHAGVVLVQLWSEQDQHGDAADDFGDVGDSPPSGMPARWLFRFMKQTTRGLSLAASAAALSSASSGE